MATGMQTGKSLEHAATAVWALTPNGKVLGTHICELLPNSSLFLSNRLGELPQTRYNVMGFDRLADAVSDHFTRYDCHVFIFSTGIAVRILAPLLASKLRDPAVVVVDDRAQHAVSLLSGHIGRANAYTLELAGLIHADPVITTATDVNQLPAIDSVARERGLIIENPEQIKAVNMNFLKGLPVAVYDPCGALLPHLPTELVESIASPPAQGPGVFCSWETDSVPRETLILRPRVLHLGIGCNRETPFKVILSFFRDTMKKFGISRQSIASLSTTEIKHDEKGILSLGSHLNVPLNLYSKDQLNSVETIENPSSVVEKHLGVKSVCEAAAILASMNGHLMVPKQKNPDVTLAVAITATHCT